MVNAVTNAVASAVWTVNAAVHDFEWAWGIVVLHGLLSMIFAVAARA